MTLMALTGCSGTTSGDKQSAQAAFARASAEASRAAADRAQAEVAASAAASSAAQAAADLAAAQRAAAAQATQAAQSQRDAAAASASATAAATAAVVQDPLRGVAWATQAYPFDCSPVGYLVLHSQDVELTGDRNRDAVVLVRCNAGAGTPPVGLYVFDGASSPAAPRLLATLLSPNEGKQAGTFTVRDRTISMRTYGFSSDRVPHCCPDETFHLTWTWHGTSGYTFGSSS